MACKPCQARAAARAAAGARGVTPNSSGLEFVVVFKGEYSDGFPSYGEAAAYANTNGGQVRSRSI